MSLPDPEPLVRHLWGPGRAAAETLEVFALLDGARDPRIAPLVRRSRLDHRCLFLGKLDPALAAAAPYLVNLAPRSAATRELLALGWGESWGVFLRSAAILQDLRRHFRRFLQVKDDQGRAFFFRFYDPRVLRTYLATCTVDELSRFFGPVESFCVEAAEAGALFDLALGPEGLAARRLRLAAEAP